MDRRPAQPPTEAQLRLIEQTYAAFAEAPRPGRDEITSHRCSECDGIRDQFAKYSVRDVPKELIGFENAALPLMTPKALRYFMPRFVDFSIRPDFDDSVVIDFLLYHLGPEKMREPYWVARFGEFSDRERRAVADYIASRKTWPGGGYDGGYHDQFFDRAEQIWGVGTPVV